VVTVPISFRSEPRESDVHAVRDIVASTAFFHDFEIDVAVELVQERLARGLASEYHFVFADEASPERASPDAGATRPRPIAYACFGPIPCTRGSFDLYWIATHAAHQGKGLGRAVFDESIRLMRAGLPDAAGTIHRARRVYIETSSQTKYEPTRRFYERCGCTLEARLPDFYAPGDDKLIYVAASTSR